MTSILKLISIIGKMGKIFRIKNDTIQYTISCAGVQHPHETLTHWGGWVIENCVEKLKDKIFQRSVLSYLRFLHSQVLAFC